jgi:hypothetical protein
MQDFLVAEVFSSGLTELQKVQQGWGRFHKDEIILFSAVAQKFLLIVAGAKERDDEGRFPGFPFVDAREQLLFV